MSDSGFPVITNPDYYIQNLEIDVSPDPERVKMGNAAIELDMTKPRIHEEGVPKFSSDCRLSIDLFTREGEEYDSDEIEKKDYGTIEVDLKIVVEAEDRVENDEDLEIWIKELKDEVETWEEDGYEETSSGFQFQLESELLSDIFYPTSKLIDNSFKGLVPRMMFGSPD